MPAATTDLQPAVSLQSPPGGSGSGSGTGSDSFTRLHITPLDTELLRIIVPAAVLPRARSISFHSLETFPEKRYGFVELPTMDAEKIKNKLNGSVLKGTKVRVEKARPEKVLDPTAEDEKSERKKKTKKNKDRDTPEGSKKRKRERDVVEGVALTDRKVQRGWTEAPDYKKKKSKKDKDDKDKEKRKRTKSKYTEQEECLTKIKVPPNAVANLDSGVSKKKHGRSREVTVHEFEKATKFPSFLKHTSSEADGKSATEFVEGKGWVDADGDVVEPVKHKTRPVPEKKVKTPKAKPQPVEEDSDDTSSSGTSSEGDSSSDASSDEEVEEKTSEAVEEIASSEQEADLPKFAIPGSALKNDSSRPTSSASSKNLTIKIPPATPSATKVHPLEALYKRTKETTAGDAAVATETPQQAAPFSFFDAEDDDSSEPAPQVPMTPFTRQDFESRTTRSAAPTPDTAHPTRMRSFWTAEGDDEEEDEDMDDGAGDGEEDKEQAGQGSSDFQAWFWENRRDLNRSWMGRRKTAAKEKRHRENKARASKAV